MKKVDMSASAVTARLKRVAELRRLCLSLQKAKLQGQKTSSNQPGKLRVEPGAIGKTK